MFSEDLWYQRHSPLMKSLVAWESSNNWVDVLNELYSAAWNWENVWDWYEIPSHAADAKHSTKMVQQELKDSFLSDYNDLFSKVELTTKRENIFAWWRWIKTYDLQSWWKTMEVDADSSASMIQLRDTLYWWDDNLVWIIQNFNNLLERFVNKKIEKEKYSMDIVIPIEYKEADIRDKKNGALFFKELRIKRNDTWTKHTPNLTFNKTILIILERIYPKE